MRPALLILRPQPGAGQTAARAAARGIETITAPLFSVRPLPWDKPSADDFDAVLLTSANAARLGGAGLGAYRHLPLYAVGAATAAAGRELGFTDVRAGGSDATALVALAAADGRRRLLHFAGRENHTPDVAGISITPRIVYAADAAATLPPVALAAMSNGAVALLHSPRAATLFRTLAEAAGFTPASLRIAAISPAALVAAGDGWAESASAAMPTDTALLDAALRLCDQRAREDG